MKKIFITLTILLLTTVTSNVSWAKKPQQVKKETQIKKIYQQQKEELKLWKKRRNDMQPLQFKDLIEENHRLKTSNRQLQEEVSLTKEHLEKLIKLKTKIDALRKQRLGTKQANSLVDSADKGHIENESGIRRENGFFEDDYEDLDALFGLQQQASSDANSDKACEINYYHLAQSLMGLKELNKEDWAVDSNGEYYVRGIIFKVQIGAYRKRDLNSVLEEQKSQEMFEQEQSEDINKYTLRYFRDYWKADAFKKELRAMGLKDAWIVAFQDGKRVPLKAVLKEVIKQKKR